ncbi:MAG TPA: hypothetical protein VGM92_04945 [Candidatus Kapabacteria bacterium]|jgi:hypothetical protein
MSTFREHAKQNWTSSSTTEHINAGSLQRIADATEKMALNWGTLVRERDQYYKWYLERGETIKHLRGTIAAMKAWNTRRKKG